MNNEISISNIVNVNISDNPSILTEENLNTIAVFTKEDYNYPIDGSIIFKSANECAQYFGIESDTYKIVSAIYNQSLNIQAGDGYVLVIPMKKDITVPATSGYVQSDKLILSPWKSIADGSFKITIDGGTEKTITGCDFTTVENFDDIASVLQNKIGNGVVVSAVDNSIIIKSASTGSSSSVVLSSDDTGTDLSTVDFLNIDNVIIVSGTAEYTGTERLQDAVSRTLSGTFYEGILSTWKLSEDEIKSTAGIVQSQNKLFIAYIENISEIDIANWIKERRYDHTRILYNGNNEADIFCAGYISKVLSVNFNGNNTVYNIADKEIVGVAPDKSISDNILNILKNAGVDSYPCVKGLGAVQCSGANEWIDVVLFKNWLKSALEVAGFNTLRTTNVVPQTNNGITVMENTYKDVLERGKDIGYIHSGKWLLNYTFGDQEVFLQNISQEGYYIYTTPVDSMTLSQRDTRKLSVSQLAIKLAGAFNSVDLLCFINK